MNEHRDSARIHQIPHFTAGRAWDDDQLLVIDRGEGCYVWDEDGNEYLDGLSGLFCTNLGHGRSDLTAAAAKQMDRLAFNPNWGFAHGPGAEAAALIADLTPGDLSRIFFVSSGSEAVESAIKFARNYHVSRGESSRYKVIAREWAYHGTTLGALAATGVPNVRKTFLPHLWDGVTHVMNTHSCGSPPGTPAADLECVVAIEEAIRAEGPETVSMIIAEPVQNGRGAVVPPPGYWQELRRICDEHGILLCADEVINAFGRLGHWFGSARFDVVPDIITFAKGVTSAYVPMGGIVVREPLLAEVWASDLGLFNHGSTFGGHPVAAAVAVANITAMRDEGVIEHVLDHEDRLGRGLEALAESHPCVKEVRGTGYFYAIELMADRPSGRELTDEQATALQTGLLGRFVRDARILVRPDNRGATMLSISPPLVADKAVLDDLVGRLDEVLNRTDEWLAAA